MTQQGMYATAWVVLTAWVAGSAAVLAYVLSGWLYDKVSERLWWIERKDNSHDVGRL